MLIYPKSEYIPRSIQKRKPLKELSNKCAVKEYNMIIDRYFFSKKKSPSTLRFKKTSFHNLPVLSENRLLHTLKSSDSKLLIENKQIKPIKKVQTKKRICITPSFIRVSKKPIEHTSRPFSLLIRKPTKSCCNLPKNIEIGLECISQDEDSPIKFTAMYK